MTEQYVSPEDAVTPDNVETPAVDDAVTPDGPDVTDEVDQATDVAEVDPTDSHEEST